MDKRRTRNAQLTRRFGAIFAGGHAKFLRQSGKVAFIDELFLRHKRRLPRGGQFDYFFVAVCSQINYI